jgi:hypothetical protein
MKLYKILTFESTHRVMQAEQLLRERGLNVTVIPTPKEFSSDCGMSLRVDPEGDLLPLITTLLQGRGIHCQIYEKVYP